MTSLARYTQYLLNLHHNTTRTTFDPTEPWSGSIIGNEPNTGIEMMSHIALTSLCEDCLAAIVALPIALLSIRNQENPVWK
jgi:hypothetical protein